MTETWREIENYPEKMTETWWEIENRFRGVFARRFCPNVKESILDLALIKIREKST